MHQQGPASAAVLRHLVHCPFSSVALVLDQKLEKKSSLCFAVRV